MKDFSLAIQLYSLRSNMARDFEGTLASVAAMGYDGVEFAGLFGKTPEEVRAMLDKYSLVPVSAHVPFVEMMQDPDKVMSDYSKLGCRFIAIPYLTPDLRPGTPGFMKVVEGAAVLGDAAHRYGMQLLYHNHDFEFTKIDGTDEYALDYLYRTVSADILETELDICWVKVGGPDPADYIRKYSNRARVVHFKDFAGKIGGKMYSLIGIDDDQSEKSSDAAFEFRPVGYGVQDIKEVLSACREARTEWVIVEQDDPSMEKTPLECAAMSADYLNSLE